MSEHRPWRWPARVEIARLVVEWLARGLQDVLAWVITRVGWIAEKVLLLGLLIAIVALYVAVPLGILYAFIRFVKWAWTN